MRIAVGSDHRGFQMKAKILDLLRGREGIEVEDVGTEGTESVDYPDVAAEVAEKVSTSQVERGVLVCGTGIGMAIAANKYPHVRAAPCHDELTAEMSRRHNDLNVLCLSADMLSDRLLDRMLDIWITTEFEGGRHQRRVDKIDKLEEEHLEVSAEARDSSSGSCSS